METLVMEELEPGALPPEADTFTALEIARLCGYNSDRWTRDRRTQLEEMFAKCANGRQLIESLKTPDGKRYTRFALESIQELQRMTSTAIPIQKGGKVKLQTIDRRMTLHEYEALLIERHGAFDEDLEPEFRAEDPGTPGGTEEVEALEEDPEMVSTAIVWQRKDQTSIINEIRDNTAAIVQDTRSTFQAFRQNMIATALEQGLKDGSAVMQAYNLGVQRAMSGDLETTSSIQQDTQPVTKARRTTRKKSV